MLCEISPARPASPACESVGIADGGVLDFHQDSVGRIVRREAVLLAGGVDQGGAPNKSPDGMRGQVVVTCRNPSGSRPAFPNGWRSTCRNRRRRTWLRPHSPPPRPRRDVICGDIVIHLGPGFMRRDRVGHLESRFHGGVSSAPRFPAFCRRAPCRERPCVRDQLAESSASCSSVFPSPSFRISAISAIASRVVYTSILLSVVIFLGLEAAIFQIFSALLQSAFPPTPRRSSSPTAVYECLRAM